MDGFYRPLICSPLFDAEVDRAGSGYRSNPARGSGDGVVVARIEQAFAAGAAGRGRRGESGARNMVVLAIAPAAIAIMVTVLFFVLVRLAC